jgi:hypothetical protein
MRPPSNQGPGSQGHRLYSQLTPEEQQAFLAQVKSYAFDSRPSEKMKDSLSLYLSGFAPFLAALLGVLWYWSVTKDNSGTEMLAQQVSNLFLFAIFVRFFGRGRDSSHSRREQDRRDLLDIALSPREKRDVKNKSNPRE